MSNTPEFGSPEYFRILDNIREEDFPDIRNVCKTKMNIFFIPNNFIIILV